MKLLFFIPFYLLSFPFISLATLAEWTWISGTNTFNVSGVYGTQGVSSASNYPGGRSQMEVGIDSYGSIWIFGGNGYDSVGNPGE